MPDFHYTFDGYYYRLLPNNPQAENAWREIAQYFESGAIPLLSWSDTAQQLRRAGYSVRRAPPAKPLTLAEIDSMLAELSPV